MIQQRKYDNVVHRCNIEAPCIHIDPVKCDSQYFHFILGQSTCNNLYIEGQCVSIHQSQIRNWFSARTDCIERGGDLAKVRTTPETIYY